MDFDYIYLYEFPHIIDDWDGWEDLENFHRNDEVEAPGFIHGEETSTFALNTNTTYTISSSAI